MPPRLSQPQPDAARRPALHHRLPGRAAWVPTPTIWCRCCAIRTSTSPTRARRSDRVLPRAQGRDRATRDEFRRRFDLMALQRNLKALGTFGYQTTTRAQPRLHPVHAANAALRAHQPREVPALRAAARAARRAHRRAAARRSRRADAVALSAEASSSRQLMKCRGTTFGVSTHLYHSYRLTREHLLEIGGARVRTRRAVRDADALRLPQSGGRRRPAAVAGRGRPRAAQRPRADRRELRRRPLGRAADAGERRRRRAGAARWRSRARAAHRAADSVRRAGRAHLGLPRTQQPSPADNSRDGARRSIEELQRLAEPLGVRVARRGDPERAVAGRLAGALRRGGARDGRTSASASTSATRTWTATSSTRSKPCRST